MKIFRFRNNIIYDFDSYKNHARTAVHNGITHALLSFCYNYAVVPLTESNILNWSTNVPNHTHQTYCLRRFF